MVTGDSREVAARTAVGVTIGAEPLIDVLHSELARSENVALGSVHVPDRRLWEAGQAREARASPLGTATTGDEVSRPSDLVQST